MTGVITVRPIGRRREGGARNERQLRGVDAFTYTDCMLQATYLCGHAYPTNLGFSFPKVGWPSNRQRGGNECTRTAPSDRQTTFPNPTAALQLQLHRGHTSDTFWLRHHFRVENWGPISTGFLSKGLKLSSENVSFQSCHCGKMKNLVRRFLGKLLMV